MDRRSWMMERKAAEINVGELVAMLAVIIAVVSAVAVS